MSWAIDQEESTAFRNALRELDALEYERTNIALENTKLDKSLAALSSFIGITSSGLNTPQGITCALYPITADPTYHRFLFKLILRNHSEVALPGEKRCRVVVVHHRVHDITCCHVSSSAGSVVHVASLEESIPGHGGEWVSNTFSVKLSPLSRLAILLSCSHQEEDMRLGMPSPHHPSHPPGMALLHVFSLDALHAAMMTDDRPSRRDNNHYYNHDTKVTMGLKLSLPKYIYGLHPNPRSVLDQLFQCSTLSLQPPLRPNIFKSLTIPTGSRENNFISGDYKCTKKGWSTCMGNSPVVVSIQSAERDPILSTASTHAVMDVTCQTNDMSSCLDVHSSMLRRVQTLHESIEQYGAGNGGGSGVHGVLLSTGILIPSPCVDGAMSDEELSELEGLNSRLERIKEAAIELRGKERGEGDFRELEKLIIELRKVTEKLPLVL